MNSEYDTDESVSLGDKIPESRVMRLFPLVSLVQERYGRAKRARMDSEQRWLKCYYNYRGLYGKEVKFLATERSRAFVKVTKTKVLAAYAQCADILFSAGKMPISVDPTPIPEGIKETVHVDLDDAVDNQAEQESPLPDLNIGFPGDGNDLKPGDTLASRVGTWLAEKLKGAKVKDGPGEKPNSLTYDPAKIAAKRMDKQIHDQLDEADAKTHVSNALFEMVLLGTGVVKGPFTVEKLYPKWDDMGQYTPVVKDAPDISHVSVWNFYPDPDATCMMDADFVIQRHKMTRSQLRALKKRPAFRKTAIDDAIAMGENYERLWWENELDDNSITEGHERFEVLEYWGIIDADMLEDFDLPIPADMKDQEEFQVNVWVCGDELLRVVLNQFTPRRIPYCAVPYEVNPYNFFGVGLAENMEDAQTLMNGFTRLAVDNAVLSGNLMIEIDETNLSPGQSTDVFAGKVIRTIGGQGQAVRGIKWPNTTQENMMMFDKFRQLADEATGIPSYSHGSTGVMSTGRTAAGMSMLMGAATQNIKQVIRNIDVHLLEPLAGALFAWNMQFNFDPTIKGDLAVNARGTASLMMKEVKSQRLIQFMQVGSNPAIAPKIKWDTIIKEIAETLDLDPEKLIASPEEAQLQAMLMQAQQQGGQAPGGGMAMDQTGGGGQNIGVGSAPQPGNPQFSGNPQQPQMGGPAPQMPPMGGGASADSASV